MSQRGSYAHTVDPTETPSEGVIAAIAALEGCDGVDLTQPLYEVVDPDAIDTLFRTAGALPGTTMSLEFTYFDYPVTIEQTVDGEVTITVTET